MGKVQHEGILAVEYVDLKSLTEHPQNARAHNKVNLDAIAASLSEFGQVGPLVVQKSTGFVIGGNGRLQVIRSLGWKRVPVVLLDIDDARAKALGLALNRTAELATWNPDVLATLVLELEATDVPMSDMGFSAEMLDELLKDAGQAEDHAEVLEDEVPEPPKSPTTKKGDVWTLGRHRLVCGDSVERRSMFAVNGVLADPPYGVHERTDRKQAGRGKLAQCNDFNPVIGDDLEFDPSPWLSFVPSVLWGANHYGDKLPPASCWLVWDKRDGVASDDNADCELAWTSLKGPARLFRHLWKGMIKASERSDKRVHPTQKPVALMVWCLGLMGCQTVLDPYAGSGPVLLAAEQSDRTCMAFELDPSYCDVIVERWQNLTGGRANRSNG